MSRNAGRGTRNAIALAALAFAVAACAREKPASDSAAGLSDSTTQPATQSGTKAPVDSRPSAPAGSGAKTADAKGGAKQLDTSRKTKILGRDSVRQGPIIGVPSIVDTAKRRPPS